MRTIRPWLFLLLVAPLAGCDSGPAMGTVSGTITIDGQVPPEGASINFIPSDGQGITTGATLDKGKYSFKVPVGKMKVEIRSPKAAKAKATNPRVDGPGRASPTTGGIILESLPPEYHEKSKLTYDVQEGSQKKDWACTTSKK
ncbi:MAG: hypothetical protein ACRC8S_10115 [Fimbriiglobus sp.]